MHSTCKDEHAHAETKKVNVDRHKLCSYTALIIFTLPQRSKPGLVFADLHTAEHDAVHVKQPSEQRCETRALHSHIARASERDRQQALVCAGTSVAFNIGA